MVPMSPRQSGTQRKTAEKKRLKADNPRNNARQENRQTVKKKRIDWITTSLGIFAVVLLVLVIVMLDGRAVGRILPSGKIGDSGSPVIERVVNESKNLEEPIVELGIPEQAVVEAAPAEPVEENTPAVAGDATARIFFVKVSGEGKISIKSILRNVPATGSPLTMAVNALMEGPGPMELSNDILSLVPESARLIGARVEGGVAFLDFNEDFRFNTLGIEGYRAQVEQIVFTATEFPTVEKVQFLIEGQRIDFLGGEGFWVGGPLGREDF